MARSRKALSVSRRRPDSASTPAARSTIGSIVAGMPPSAFITQAGYARPGGARSAGRAM